MCVLASLQAGIIRLRYLPDSSTADAAAGLARAREMLLSEVRNDDAAVQKVVVIITTARSDRSVDFAAVVSVHLYTGLLSN